MIKRHLCQEKLNQVKKTNETVLSKRDLRIGLKLWLEPMLLDLTSLPMIRMATVTKGFIIEKA